MKMLKNTLKVLAPVGMVLAGLLASMSSAQAIPAFARQTAQACTACHTQHFPTLNSFGRMFKAQGYTMGGTQESVVGNGLDIPGTLNAAIVTTIGVKQIDNRTTGKKTTLTELPASLSLYFGGRIGTNTGFLMEMPFEGAFTETKTMSGDVVENEVTPAAGPGIAQLGSFKMNYIEEFGGINTGVNMYTSAMAGPAYGYELLSTGAMGMNVAVTGANAMGAIGMHMEHGSTLMGGFMDTMSTMVDKFAENGQTATMRMTMAGQASGVGVSAQTSNWFAYYSPYYGVQALDGLENTSMAHYVRLAWTPTLGGWDLGIGTQIYTGSFGYVNGDESTQYDASARTLDFQAQGDIAGKATGVYVTYATAPGSTSDTELNWYNQSKGGDNQSFGVLVEVEVVERFSLNVGHTRATYWSDMMVTGSSMGGSSMGGSSMGGSSMGMGSNWMSNENKGTLTQVGANYMLAPNKRLGFKYSDFGDDFDTNVVEADITLGF